MALATAVCRYVLFRSFRCILDSMHLVIGRQMRLISRRYKVFRLEKLGGFAMVSCCVLMVFSGTLMEFGQRWHGGPFLVAVSAPTNGGIRCTRSHCSACHDLSPVISRDDKPSKKSRHGDKADVFVDPSGD